MHRNDSTGWTLLLSDYSSISDYLMQMLGIGAQIQSLYLLHWGQWNSLRISPNSKSIPLSLWAPAHPSTSSIHPQSTPWEHSCSQYQLLLSCKCPEQRCFASLNFHSLKFPFSQGLGLSNWCGRCQTQNPPKLDFFSPALGFKNRSLVGGFQHLKYYEGWQQQGRRHEFITCLID